MPAFLDTNVLVYAFDLGEPEKREVARSLVREHLMEGDGMISVQVLREFYSASQKGTAPLDSEEAATTVNFLATFSPSSEDPRMVVRAVERVKDGFSFWDALIVEAALRGGADLLLSEDMQDGRVVAGMRIENPFT